MAEEEFRADLPWPWGRPLPTALAARMPFPDEASPLKEGKEPLTAPCARQPGPRLRGRRDVGRTGGTRKPRVPTQRAGLPGASGNLGFASESPDFKQEHVLKETIRGGIKHIRRPVWGHWPKFATCPPPPRSFREFSTPYLPFTIKHTVVSALGIKLGTPWPKSLLPGTYGR